MKNKKLLLLLVLPLIATTFLFGCGNPGRTGKGIQSKMNDLVKSYNIDENTNALFKVQDGHRTFLMEVKYNQNIPFKDEKILDGRFINLQTKYQKILTYIYLYYNEFQEGFFENIDNKNVTQDELKKLSDAFIDLKNESARFVYNRENLERNVDLFTEGGVISTIIESKVDAFNSAFNGLIQASLNYVSKFRDIHYKYFFSELKIDENTDPIVLKSFAKQTYYDSLLTYANYVYYDIFKAIERKGLVDFTILSNAGEQNKFNAFNYINGFDVQFPEMGKINNVKVNKLRNSLNIFKQYFRLYKKAYSHVDFDIYNQYRFNKELFNKNKYTFNNSQNAYKTIVEDFELNKAQTFLKEIKSFKN